MNLNYYPELDSQDFNRELYRKKEFSLTPNLSRKPTPYLYQIQPHQLFVKNFLSPHTPYNGLLLFYGTGSGKTCAALQIVEQFKPYLLENGGRIIVLGKSGEHVENIFSREMYNNAKELTEINEQLLAGTNHCLGNKYASGLTTSLVDPNSFSVNIENKKQYIKSIYQFYGFTQFHKLVKKLEAENKFLEDEFANCIFIVDEAHNLSGLDADSELYDDTTASVVSDSPLREEDDLQPSPIIEVSHEPDDSVLIKAERVRIKIIKLKRQIILTRQKQLELLAKHQIVQLEKYLIDLQNLLPVLQQFEEEYVQQQILLTRLYGQMLRNRRVGEEEIQLVTQLLQKMILKLPKGDFLNQFTKQMNQKITPTINYQDEAVLKFLQLINQTTGFTNIYQTFLETSDSSSNSQKSRVIEGLKTYQALKKVLISLNGSKVVLLTATPMRDRPDSIVNLLNILRINDGYEELSVNQIFGPDGPNLDALKQAAIGYISRFSGDTSNFPKVVWDLSHHVNQLDRNILQLPEIEPVILQLNPKHRGSARQTTKQTPELHLIGCRSSEQMDQDIYYQMVNQTENETSGARDLRPILEFLCNFAYPLTNEMVLDTTFNGKSINLTYNDADYLMNFRAQFYFKQLFEFTEKNNQIANVKYRQPEKTGKFLNPSLVTKYSAKLGVLIQILKQVSVRDGLPGGINLIYSKFSYFGCYLIALTLEQMGYRKYPQGHLWNTEPKRKICSICGLDISEHNSDTHRFRQAYYLLAVGSSEEVSKYLPVLTSENNRYGETIKLIIGTSTITEGLDFKFIRYIHVFEPWYNYTRLDQLAGRGSRLGSHLGYPKGSYSWDNVTMFLYCYLNSVTDLSQVIPQSQDSNYQSMVRLNCQISRKYRDKSVYLTRDLRNYLTTLEKDCQIKQVEKVLNDVAIDCPLYYGLSNQTDVADFSRQCYYNRCGLNCQYLPPSFRVTVTQIGFYLETKPNGSKQKLDDRTTLVKLGYTGKNIIGIKSGLYYDLEQPFLKQLLDHGDLDPQLPDQASQIVVWDVETKDMSTFYLSFFDDLAKQLTKLLQYLFTKQMLNPPIIRLDYLVKMVSERLNFNLELDLLTQLVQQAMSLLSGAYRPKEYGITGLVILPLETGSTSRDIYYVFHPDNVLPVKSGTYHKYFWPKTISEPFLPIKLNNWNLYRLPETISQTKSSDAGPAEIRTTGAVQNLAPLFVKYQQALMQSKLSPRYQMYSVFLKNDASELTKLLYYLITVTSESSAKNTPNQLILINYLAHYLEYLTTLESETRVKIQNCNCQNFFHSHLKQRGDKDQVFQFLYRVRGDIIGQSQFHVEVTINQTTQTLSYSNTTLQIPSFDHQTNTADKSSREDSKIAMGLYGTTTNKIPKFKVKNIKFNLMWADEHPSTRKKTKSNFRFCETYTFNRENTYLKGIFYDLDQMFIDLNMQVSKIVEWLRETKIMDGLDILPNYPEKPIQYKGDDVWEVKLVDGNVQQFTRQNELRQFLCPQIELMLHFLHAYDPDYGYFNYNLQTSRAEESESGTTRSSATKEKKKAAAKRK